MTTPTDERYFSFRVAEQAGDPFIERSGGSTTTPSRQRRSFVARLRQASKTASWRDLADDDALSPAASERPAIPSALPSGEVASVPLPVVPMIVLSIVMLGEFLSANVATPFLLFMVEGFGVFQDEADVGFWTGILVSCFFITQFLTSLLWATAAEKHGTRAVLFVSLLGSSLTCLAFGTATTLPQAMCIRLLQGIFAGAIGVGRGNIVTITDPSNEGRAYAILGFAWGFGGVAGAIIGGVFESPATKWSTFSNITLFMNYPYLLPTTIAASVTFTGAMLSLLLSRDGGPREGAIRLHAEKPLHAQTIPEEEPVTPFAEEDRPQSVVTSFRRNMQRKLSGYFSKRVYDAQDPSSPGNTPPLPLTATPRRSSSSKVRSFSRTSRTAGSAYGYGSNTRNRLASNMSQSLAGRRGSLASTIARRRRSTAVDVGVEDDNQGANLNFAQRLLMANENAVTGIADLWVAAAINADNEDVFLPDEEEALEDESAVGDDDQDELTPTRAGRSARSPTRSTMRFHRASNTSATSFVSPRNPAAQGNIDQTRRVSASVPAIFTHTGVRTPPAATEVLSSAPQSLGVLEDIESGPRDALVSIAEHRPQQSFVDQPTDEPLLEAASEKSQSMLSLLPIMVIIQYGMLALHSTTHDQIFLSYLVSKYQAGGLNLNAGHFAQLIALMCLAQIAYQFYLYPNMGPPRGRFSHLSMFRIGSLLFIPAYLTVTLYRPLASSEEDGNAFLMAALVLSTALRYAGITFAYTSIAILLNYMSPPHILGYANGIAQSIVSFARFLGPVLGGYLWSTSVNGNPSGYPIGFIVCSAVTGVAVALSFFIR